MLHFHIKKRKKKTVFKKNMLHLVNILESNAKSKVKTPKKKRKAVNHIWKVDFLK